MKITQEIKCKIREEVAKYQWGYPYVELHHLEMKTVEQTTEFIIKLFEKYSNLPEE